MIYNDIPFKKTVENVRFWVEPEAKTLVNVLDDYEYTLVFCFFIFIFVSITWLF